jgi:hypothetical protein
LGNFGTSLSLVQNKLVANPMTLIYNASVVNFYNATSSLVSFENKNILFYIL